MPASTRPAIWIAALVLLVAGAIALRLHPAVVVDTPSGLDFLDADTVRRLVHLEAGDAATEYPFREPRDGFPAGVTMQWTMPMDWVIRALDPVAPRLHSQQRSYEGGAAIAGPVLGALAVLAFALLARRFLPLGQAGLAALLYACCPAAVEVTRLGNGDHQSLQDLCSVIAFLGVLTILRGTAGAMFAAATGAALGLALWINAESIVLYAVAGLSLAVGVGATATADRPRTLQLAQYFAGAGAAVTVSGQLLESAGTLTLHWDRVSCLQGTASVALLGLFAVASRLDRRGWAPLPMLAASAATVGAVAAAPYLLIGPLRTALLEQLAAAKALSDFAYACVAEYNGLFHDGVGLARLVLSDLLFIFPLCLLGLWWNRSAPAPMRAGLATQALVFTALVLGQVKMSHYLAIPWALVLACGGAGLLAAAAQRIGASQPSQRRWHWVGGSLVAAIAVWHVLALNLTPPPSTEPIEDRRELIAAVRQLEFAPTTDTERERLAVMAPWDLGHYLLYDTDKPVVASSYQRRVDSIQDSVALLCTEDPDAALQILRTRGSRWFVRTGDPSFLLQAHELIPGHKQLGRREQGRTRLDPAVKNSFWLRTAVGATHPRLARARVREQSAADLVGLVHRPGLPRLSHSLPRRTVARLLLIKTARPH